VNTLFEPLDERTKKVILDDVKAVVSYDPRLAVDEVLIQQLDAGIQIQIALTYMPSNTSTTMNLTFDRESGIVS
jgi:phage baseplate assembly protein W